MGGTAQVRVSNERGMRFGQPYRLLLEYSVRPRRLSIESCVKVSISTSLGIKESC